MYKSVALISVLLALASCKGTVDPASSSDSAIANPDNWPAAKSPAELSSAATEAKIDALIAKMTIEQKVGQLIQADIGSITPDDLKKYPLGSLLAGGNSGPYGDERAGPDAWDRLVREFRGVSMVPAENGVAIPVIFGVDAVHGHNNLPSATVFPHNIGLGAARDPEMIRRIGAATAAEVAGSGIEWTFAPTLAVPKDTRWGRTYEGYSSDPEIVASYGEAMVQGLQGTLVADQELAADKVAATAKHFLADGGTTNGKDQGDAEISEEELVAQHAQGYPAAIDAGALTVMVSFSSWNGVKNHGNPSLLTDVLKGRMGFNGFVVGDWNGHGQVDGCTVTDCARAINAGLDMFMAPDSWKGLYENTLKSAKEGVISAERLDDAVRRILRVKFKLGLFDEATSVRRDYAAVGAPDHLALAREAVAKSLVLLKNNGSLLPIKPGAKVLVTGAGADSMAMQSGGWTISWQGTDVTREDFPNGQTIWQGIKSAVSDAGGSAVLSDDGSFSNKPDVAIVVFGETPYAEFQGDVPTLDYQPAGATDLATLKALKAKGVPVVAVFLSGRPMFTNPELNASDAFVAAWLPGTQGAGVADVLIAGADGKPRRGFTGRLPFVWPSNAKSPVESELFPLGFGLNYTSSSNLGALSEDPVIDLAKAVNAENFFAAGRAQAPWALRISDAGGDRDVGTTPMATPQKALASRSVDVRAQEDGKSFKWSGKGSLSINGPAVNVSKLADQGYVLALGWRIDAASKGPVAVSVSNVALDATKFAKPSKSGDILTTEIPLKCFERAGADLDAVGNALRIESGAGFAMTLLSAKLAPTSKTIACPSAAR